MTLAPEQAKLVAAGIVSLVANQETKHPQHVKTPQGAKWYKQPIGSLIVAKPHPHGLQPHERLVYAGGQAWAVPKQAVVYVPAHLDVHDDAAVATTGKIVQVGPDPAKGEGKLILLSSTPGKEPSQLPSSWNLANGWKVLKPGEQKSPVYVGGKLAGWVPSTWKLYATTGVAVWAKDPAGNWHFFNGEGGQQLKPGAANPDEWVKDGLLKPLGPETPEPQLAKETPPPAPSAPEPKKPAAAEPPGKLYQYGNSVSATKFAKDEAGNWWELDPEQGWFKSGVNWDDTVTQGIMKPVLPGGAEAAAVSVPHIDHGYIKVTAPEISSAISILQADQSTAVKQPLAKAGHPLAKMDYHLIAKDQIKAHPELKVPGGTKTQHVGKVKGAILHYLAEQHAKLSATMAAQEQAAQAKESAEKAAEHAQELFTGKMVFGGIPVTQGQLQAALAKLEAVQSTAIKQPLAAIGSPLAQGDYWQVVHSVETMYPEWKGKLKAKPLYIEAIKITLANWGTDQAWAHPEGEDHPGQPHPDVLALHNAIMAAPWPDNNELGAGYDTTDQALAAALIYTSGKPQIRYVKQGIIDKKFFLIIHPKPTSGTWWEVTPEHQLTLHDGAAEVTYTPAETLQVLKSGLAMMAAAKADKEEPKPAEIKPVTLKQAQYHLGGIAAGATLYQVTSQDSPGIAPAGHLYVRNVNGQWWHLGEPDDAGSAPAKINSTAAQNWLEKGLLKPVATKSQLGGGSTPVHLITEAPAEGPEPGTLEHFQQLLKPYAKGSKLYAVTQNLPNGVVKKGDFYVESPGGNVVWLAKGGTKPIPIGSGFTSTHKGWLEQGILKHVATSGSVSGTIPTTPPGEATIPVEIKGKVAAFVPAGSQVYWAVTKGATPAESSSRYVKYPDGSWWFISHQETKPYTKTWANPELLVADGTLKLVEDGTPAPEPLTHAKAAFINQTGWSALHSLIQGNIFSPEAAKGLDDKNANDMLAWALNQAAKYGHTFWVQQAPYGNYGLSSTPPVHGVPGKLASPFYQVSEYHEIISFNATGDDTPWSVADVTALVKQKWPKPDPTGGVQKDAWALVKQLQESPVGHTRYIYWHPIFKQWVFSEHEPPEHKQSKGWIELHPDGHTVLHGTPGGPQHQASPQGGAEDGKPGALTPEVLSLAEKLQQGQGSAPLGPKLAYAVHFLNTSMSNAVHVHEGLKTLGPGDEGWLVTVSSGDPGHTDYAVSKGENGSIHVAVSVKGAPYTPVSSANVAKLIQGQSPGQDISPDIPVVIGGMKVGYVPAGSIVYRHKAPDVATRWVRLPDGSWKTFGPSGLAGQHSVDDEAAATQHTLKSFNDSVATGTLIPDEASMGAVTESPGPAGEPVQIIGTNGSVVGTAPAGTVKYVDLGTGNTVAWKKPDGSWITAGAVLASQWVASGPQAASWAGKVVSGELVPAEKWLELHQKALDADPLLQLKEELKSGTVAPGADDGSLEYALAKAALWSAKKSALRYAREISPGVWDFVPLEPAPEEHYYTVGWKNDVFSFTEHGPGLGPAGAGIDHDPQELLDAAGKFVIPHATFIQYYSGAPDYKYKTVVVKAGFYYAPGKKQYIEVEETGDGYFSLKYYGANGQFVKRTRPAMAKLIGTTMTEHHEEKKSFLPKGAKAPPPVKAASYAEGFKPGGTYQFKTADPMAGLGGLSVSPDGSALYTPPEGGGSVPVYSSWITSQLSQGKLLDGYGTTVVRPGIQPEKYWLFNGYSTTDQGLKGILAGLEKQGGTPQAGWTPAAALGFDHGGPGWQNLISWLEAKNAVTAQQKHDALKGLLHELLEVPQASPLQSVQATYLKGLPPGIKHPMDVFEGNNLGYPKPYAKGWPANIYALDSPGLTDLIKGISQQYGGGKVVGTHVSSLTKAEKQQWLDAWQHGWMEAVFALDAKGGKVSPAHPGAPKNTETHNITWAPWGAGETPAGKEVPGDWTSLDITLPKAEIDNYIIQAGLQHAEYLSWALKRAWVVEHRKGNQQKVDELSQAAHDSWENGDNTITTPPVWTDNIKPAKSYDTFLEDKTAASNWLASAKNDFIADHAAELAPFAAQWNADNGYTQSSDSWKTSYSGAQVVQRYLDHLAALEDAEAKKPRYTATDVSGGVPAALEGYQGIKDQYGSVFGWKESTPGLRARDLAVATLARMWGFKHPEVREAELDGTVGIAHQVPDAQGYWEGATTASFKAMSQRQMADIAREHVFNWAVGNPMAHPGTYAQMTDGSVAGTDHSGAFTDWGTWDGLDAKGGAGDHAAQFSSLLYDAIRKHQLTKKVADQAYIEAIRTARRMSQLSDERYAAILKPAFALMASPPDLAAVTARKNSLEADFQEMWGRVYKDAHWTLPEVPKEKLLAGLHSGFSEPSFFDHVMAAKSFGAPAFFAGPDLDEGSFLVWTELAGDGPDAIRYVRGESAARGKALAAMTAWSKAHQTDAEVNTPAPTTPGEKAKASMTSWYAGIIDGAKAVSRHVADQMWEGKYTKDQLAKFYAARKDAQERLALAQAALEEGAHSKAYAEFEAKWGLPQANVDGANYYLGLMEKVIDRKEVNPSLGKFQQGDLPDWTPPVYPEKAKAVKETPKVKVVLKKAYRELGYTSSEVAGGQQHLLNPETGELHLHGQTFTYPGLAWHITLPTGEVIEYWDGPENGTPKGQTGRIRFKSDPTKGSASLERIRAQLQEMGLPLEEAQPHDMELLYWRHLAGVLANRKDRSEGKHAQVWDTLKQYFSTHQMEWNSSQLKNNVRALAEAGLPPAEELALWHEAWAHLTSPEQVQQWVADGKHLPHLKHWDVTSPQTPGGKPVWYRFDADPAWLASRKLLSHSYQGGGATGVLMARTGGGFSTEGRLRALGTSITGMSSASDMSDSHGSAWVFYTRLNKPDSAGNMKISPRVLAETQTYGYDSDNFGNISNRASSAYFSLPKAAAWTGSSNETLVKDGVSLLDDIELLEVPASMRDKVIAELKAHGITEIRGVPVEQRIVTAANTGLQQLKSEAVSRAPHWFDQPATPYVAPPSAIVTAGGIETKAELEGKEETGELAGFIKDAEAEPSSDGAPAKELDKLFYGEAGKGAFGHGSAATVAVKQATAARLAEDMPESADEAAKFMEEVGMHVPASWGDDVRERMVAGLIGLWAIDGNHTPLAIAIQNEAAKLFGLPPNPVAPPATGGSIGAEFLPTGMKTAAEIEEKYGYIIRDFLKAQYLATQADFAKAGIENVTLYRVMKWPVAEAPDWSKGLKAGDQIPTGPSRPISAWSYLPEGPAADAVWGKGGHEVMVKTTLPRALLLGYPRSGFGALRQQEIVALSSPGEWTVVKAS